MSNLLKAAHSECTSPLPFLAVPKDHQDAALSTEPGHIKTTTSSNGCLTGRPGGSPPLESLAQHSSTTKAVEQQAEVMSTTLSSETRAKNLASQKAEAKQEPKVDFISS